MVYHVDLRINKVYLVPFSIHDDLRLEFGKKN